MNTGLDEWVANVATFFSHARRFLSVNGGDQNLQSASSTSPDAPTTDPGPSDTSRQVATVSKKHTSASLKKLSQLPSEDSFKLPTDLLKASPIEVEVSMLFRAQRRRNTLLTPEVINNLELAAYYARLLINVSRFSTFFLSPILTLNP